MRVHYLLHVCMYVVRGAGRDRGEGSEESSRKPNYFGRPNCGQNRGQGRRRHLFFQDGGQHPGPP